MFLSLLVQNPQILMPVLRATPGWVWGLLAGLVVLGASQVRDRSASLVRISVMPVAMTAFAVWGLAGAFGASPVFGSALLAWLLVAATAFAAVSMTAPPRGTSFDAGDRMFQLPGSWVPLALIVATFLTRYVVNVDIAMKPALKADDMYTILVAGLYGISTGVFAGRAARLWRLAAENGGLRVLRQRDAW